MRDPQPRRVRNPFRCFNISPKAIHLAVTMYTRYPLSLRQVEDPLFVRINGETRYLWRTVNHEGEVPEVFALRRRNRKAALRFLKRRMKRYGRPGTIVTDRLPSYGAAMRAIGIAEPQACGRRLGNRAENSHQPFRRREGAMAKFRDIETLQKFASVHAPRHNRFNKDHRPDRRDIFIQSRSAAPAEWRQLAA